MFRDRADAGRRLAAELAEFAAPSRDVVVLGLPRGGVPVAAEVASALAKPLDIYVVRKLGLPGHPELAMGAIASGGVRVVNDLVLSDFGLGQDVIDAVAVEEKVELERQERELRGGASAEPLAGRTVLVVDDGLATGASMRAAVRALRAQGVGEIVAAVPVAARHTCAELSEEVDAMVCALTPARFHSVGEWYEDFHQVGDAEVRASLRAAKLRG